MVKCCFVSLLFIGHILDASELHQLTKPNKKETIEDKILDMRQLLIHLLVMGIINSSH